MNEQNLNPNEPIHSSKNIWIAIIAAVITAVIVGSGVFAWQKSSLPSTEQSLQQQITNLQKTNATQYSYSKKTQEPTQQTTPAPVAQTPAQPVANNNVTTVPADWKTYQDQKYGYQFQYPSDWTLVGDNGSDPDGYNVTVWQGDGLYKDNIQIVKVMYGTNADGTTSNRESYLKMLTSGSYSKISVAGRQEYYAVSETKGGPNPTVHLVGDKEIFLMNFYIYDSKKTSLASAEKLLKQVIETFKFTN